MLVSTFKLNFFLFISKVKLPHENTNSWFDEDKDRDSATRASTRMSRYTVDVPQTAIAGLVGDMEDKLEDIQNPTPKVVPVSQAWTNYGDIFIGCKGGQLLKVGVIFLCDFLNRSKTCLWFRILCSNILHLLHNAILCVHYNFYNVLKNYW